MANLDEQNRRVQYNFLPEGQTATHVQYNNVVTVNNNLVTVNNNVLNLNATLTNTNLAQQQEIDELKRQLAERDNNNEYHERLLTGQKKRKRYNVKK